MSRNHYRSSIGNHPVVVGWDPPLQTFFAQVWDGKYPEAPGAELVLWVGCRFREIERIADLQRILLPFGEIPDSVIDVLLIEHDNNCSLEAFVPRALELIRQVRRKK